MPGKDLLAGQGWCWVPNCGAVWQGTVGGSEFCLALGEGQGAFSEGFAGAVETRGRGCLWRRGPPGDSGWPSSVTPTDAGVGRRPPGSGECLGARELATGREGSAQRPPDCVTSHNRVSAWQIPAGVSFSHRSSNRQGPADFRATKGQCQGAQANGAGCRHSG